MKRADGGRPISKDTIAQQAGGRLYIWDLISGAGTGHGVLQVGEREDITGQVFVVVTPTNHLGTVGPVHPPTTDLESRVAALEHKLAAMKSAL